MCPARVSIVIPTYNRKETLLECLEALAAQTVAREEMEIVVVDDGSRDGSPEAARGFLRDHFPLWQLMEGPNRGPALARNRGILASSAPLVLLLGDDMIAAPDLLEQHLARHREHPGDECAALGYVTWHPKLPVTPVMEWIDREDRQFAYGRIRHGDRVDYRYFYSCNISLKRAFLTGHPLFDTEFPSAAHEDTEFGYRLQKRGLQIFHNRNAVTYHDHPMTLESFCRRMERVGESAVILHRKLSELAPRNRSGRMSLFRPRGILVSIAYLSLKWLYPPASTALRPGYYRHHVRLAYRKGYRRAEELARARGI